VKRSSEPAGHPDLGHYFDRITDRAELDAHVSDCLVCQARLADVDDRLDRLTCAGFVELVTAFLEAAVDPRERARIDSHLATCEGCRNYLDQMRATIATIGRTVDNRDVVDLPEPVLAGLRAAFRRWSRSRTRTSRFD
jgi:hypothetical protein